MAADNASRFDISNEKINEALELLNEAAKEKKDELTKLVDEKYGDIKGVFSMETMYGKEKIMQMKRTAEDALQRSEEKLREAVDDIDTRVRQNPWSYLSGVAVFALLLGYVMGNSKRD